jgi:hypothetical protein
VAERCREEEPELVQIGKTWVRCHFPVQGAET